MANQPVSIDRTKANVAKLIKNLDSQLAHTKQRHFGFSQKKLVEIQKRQKQVKDYRLAKAGRNPLGAFDPQSDMQMIKNYIKMACDQNISKINNWQNNNAPNEMSRGFVFRVGQTIGYECTWDLQIRFCQQIRVVLGKNKGTDDIALITAYPIL